MNKSVLIILAIVTVVIIYMATKKKTAAGDVSTTPVGTGGGATSQETTSNVMGVSSEIQGILTGAQKSNQVAAIIEAARKEGMWNGMVVYDAAIKAGADPVNAAVAASQVAQNTAITQQMMLLAPNAQPSSYSLTDYFGIFNYEEAQAIQNAQSAVQK